MLNLLLYVDSVLLSIGLTFTGVGVGDGDGERAESDGLGVDGAEYSAWSSISVK